MMELDRRRRLIILTTNYYRTVEHVSMYVRTYVQVGMMRGTPTHAQADTNGFSPTRVLQLETAAGS